MNRWLARVSLVFALAGAGCTGEGSSAGPTDAGTDARGTKGLDASVDGTLGGDTTPPTFGGLQSATAIDQSHVALAWSAATDPVTPPGMLSYRVYVGTTPGSEVFTQPLLTTPAGATGALLQGMQGGTTFYFVVRAVDAAGNEDDNTVEKSATTLDTSTPLFAGVQTVTGTGIGQLLVTWNPAVDSGCPSSAIAYDIYYSTTSGGEDFTTPSATTTAGALKYTLTGLAQGQTYYVVVRAVDSAGNSDANTYERSARTLDNTPPTFAGAVSATAEGTAILLTWLPATDAVDPSSELVYDVFMATTSYEENLLQPAFTTAPGATSYTAINLAVSTTYYFIVRARDTSGNEDTNVAEVFATTGAAAVVTPPTFAGIVSATGTSASTILLSWAAASDADTPASNIVYDIYAAQVSGAEEYGSGPTFTTPLGATSFTVTGLPPLQTEYFVVRARDLDGNEDKNVVEASGETLADVSPPSFGGLTSATATNPVTVSLTWLAASDQATPSTSMTYAIYMGTTKGGEATTPVVTSPPGATSIAVTGLQPLTTYWFYARAVDAGGNPDTTPAPVEVSATTPADTPAFGGATTIASTSPVSITVGWTPATDPLPTTTQASLVYLVYVSQTKGAELSATPVVSPAGATSQTVTGLTPATTYYVIVRAQNPAGHTDTNTTELFQATEVDTTKPTFAGAAGVGTSTSTTLTVNWAAASDPITPPQDMLYQICMTKVSGDCDGTMFSVTTTVTGTLSYTATGLTQDTTYYFVVRAQDQYNLNDGNSNEVSGITVQTVFPPPTFTTVPTVTGATYTTLPMSWAATVAPASTITYGVCYSTSSTACAGGTGTTVGLTPDTATSVTISGLPPAKTATTYYVSVTATSQGGSTTSQSPVATLADTVAPSVPTGLTATLSTTYPNSMGLSWTASTDPASSAANISYVLCANPGVTAGCTITFAVGDAITSSFLGAQASTQGASLGSNTVYTFTVAAKDQAGNQSAPSPGVTATTAVSFANDINIGIFLNPPTGTAANPCNSCHGGGDVGPTPGPYTYAFITGMTTPTPTPPAQDGNLTECAAGLHFVVAGNLDASLMYQKMSRPNVCSSGDPQMPYGGPYDAAGIMGAWIVQGANNN
jgi:hypothetical protein